MRKYALIWVLAILLAVPAAARPVDDFTVKDGFGSFPFKLAGSEMKLFYYSHQNESSADMRSRVFAYTPTGQAPIDSPVAREEIAKAVKWLFFNEVVRVDATRPAELPQGITCFPMILIADGSSNDGLGLRFTVENGAIKKVEAAACMTCGVMAKMVTNNETNK